MTEARLGRLLVAALHEAIAEQLPLRAGFYEHWLNADGLREGSMGLAAMTAVLGFLRTEGDGYGRVVDHAGRLAATWSWAAMPQWQRTAIARLPRRLRWCVVRRLVARVAARAYPATRARLRSRGQVAALDVSDSVFCTAREAPDEPLCGFYLAAAVALLTAAGLPAGGRMDTCRAMKGPACSGTIDVSA